MGATQHWRRLKLVANAAAAADAAAWNDFFCGLE